MIEILKESMLQNILIKDMESGDVSILGKPISIEPEVEEIFDAVIRFREQEFQFSFSDLRMSKSQYDRAMYYFLVHGNNLYLKFPKKLRRKHDKNNKAR